MTYNYIYLLQTRECLAIRQNIYKIGKTTQPLLKRFKQYPKGAVLLHQTICVNCHTLEQQLISKFKYTFERQRFYGNEYFKGDWHEMRRIINDSVDNELNNSAEYMTSDSSDSSDDSNDAITIYESTKPPMILNSTYNNIKYLKNLSMTDALINDCFK